MQHTLSISALLVVTHASDDPKLSQAISASLHEASGTADSRSTQDLVTCLRQENLSADNEENVKITIQ